MGVSFGGLLRSRRRRASASALRSGAPAGRPASEGGFTLLEVLVAIAIIAIVTVILLGRRVEIIRDTTTARDQKMAWALLAQKMAEIELDPDNFLSETGGSSGDFHDVGTEYSGFLYRWEYAKEDVPTNDPLSKTEKPKQIYRVKLFVKKAEEEGDLASMEAMFLAPKKETR